VPDIGGRVRHFVDQSFPQLCAAQLSAQANLSLFATAHAVHPSTEPTAQKNAIR
jgi:hypothetical protein